MATPTKAAAVTREYVDDRVLSFHEWCKLNNLSPATGRRIISAGNGPNVVQLSPRRIVSLSATIAHGGLLRHAPSWEVQSEHLQIHRARRD